MKNPISTMTPSEREAYYQKREKVIMRTGWLSIIANLCFAVVKFIIGALSHSVAVFSDAVNNATDAISGIVTVVGTRLAARKPTKSNPQGFGRIEYLSTLIISLIILIAGYELLKTSVLRILHPALAHVTYLEMVVILATVALKLVLWRVDVRNGDAYDSGSLKASGSDALNDAFSSSLTIVAALCAKLFRLDVDGWIGLIISGLIIWSGFDDLKDAAMALIGTSPNKETASEIYRILLSHPPILRAYNLEVTNYGPTEVKGTVDVEIPADIEVEEAFIAMNDAKIEVYDKTGIQLTLALRAVNNKDTRYESIYGKVKKSLLDMKEIEAICGFNYEEKRRIIVLNVLVSFNVDEIEEVTEKITKRVEGAVPDTHAQVLVFRSDVGPVK